MSWDQVKSAQVGKSLGKSSSPARPVELIIGRLTDMRLILEQAVRQRLIRTNPVDDVERPRCEPPEMKILSAVCIVCARG